MCAFGVTGVLVHVLTTASYLSARNNFLFKTCSDREKIQAVEDEEKALREENVRLQRRLLRETERREQLTRQLSESESSLEMDDERQDACLSSLGIVVRVILTLSFLSCRHFNEMATGRHHHASSPAPISPSPTRRSISPALRMLNLCQSCIFVLQYFSCTQNEYSCTPMLNNLHICLSKLTHNH